MVRYYLCFSDASYKEGYMCSDLNFDIFVFNDIFFPMFADFNSIVTGDR